MWSRISLCLGHFRRIAAVFNHLENSSAKLWEFALLWSEISNCVWGVAMAESSFLFVRVDFLSVYTANEGTKTGFNYVICRGRQLQL